MSDNVFPSFSGSVPGHYDAFLGPMFFEPYALDIVQRISPSRVQVALEIACGTGRVTRHLRKALPGRARLIASDISPEMLSVARSNVRASGIEWKVFDMQKIPMDRDSLDLVVCCFGYMLAPDPQGALAESCRVLRPGGMLLMNTWDKLEHNEASDVFRTIVRQYLGDTFPEKSRLPFSMHDPTEVTGMLDRAGFSKVSSEIVKKVSVCPSAADAAFGLTHGGTLYHEIMNRNPEALPEIMASVEDRLRAKFGDAPMRAPMSALVIEAFK